MCYAKHFFLLNHRLVVQIHIEQLEGAILMNRNMTGEEKN